jgi:Virulence-associated protein E-like domain
LPTGPGFTACVTTRRPLLRLFRLRVLRATLLFGCSPCQSCQASTNERWKPKRRALGLGNSRRELRAEVACFRAQLPRNSERFEEEANEFGVELLPQALDLPLAGDSFPMTRMRVSGQLEVLDHPKNLALIMDRYDIRYRYNVITKTTEWEHPDISSEGDNAENRLFSELVGLASMNQVPKTNLDTHLLGLGDARSYNPVTDYLSGLEWDGTSRIGRLAAQFDASDPEVAQIAMRVFLIQACAAADHAEAARALNPDVVAHFEYVIVLRGEQGVNKTKGFKKLLPRALRQFYREGKVLNLADKDSVKEVLSNWIVELGELDATFSKSAVSHKKAFLSQSRDEIRAPYARKPSMYGRRTVFVGTVNEESFLADETGNRRFIPLTVGQLQLDWPEEELEQAWAEAWHLYSTGEKWWPTSEEEEVLKVNADKYRVRTEIEERITRHYAWGQAPQEGEPRKTASEIYSTVMPYTARGPYERDLKTVGATLKRLWSNSGRAEWRGGQLVVKNTGGQYVSVNAQSGKNRGWLLPPVSVAPNSAALAAAAQARGVTPEVDK